LKKETKVWDDSGWCINSVHVSALASCLLRKDIYSVFDMRSGICGCIPVMIV